MEIEILIGLVTGAGGAMSAAILFLYKNVMQLNHKHNQLNKQLGLLEGKQEGIRELSKQVLDTVHRAASARQVYRDDR